MQVEANANILAGDVRISATVADATAGQLEPVRRQVSSETGSNNSEPVALTGEFTSYDKRGVPDLAAVLRGMAEQAIAPKRGHAHLWIAVSILALMVVAFLRCVAFVNIRSVLGLTADSGVASSRSNMVSRRSTRSNGPRSSNARAASKGKPPRLPSKGSQQDASKPSQAQRPSSSSNRERQYLTSGAPKAWPSMMQEVNPGSIGELRSCLENHDVDISMWGQGGLKSIASLFDELEAGHCKLRSGDGLLMREVQILQVRIRAAFPDGPKYLKNNGLHDHLNGNVAYNVRDPAKKTTIGCSKDTELQQLLATEVGLTSDWQARHLVAESSEQRSYEGDYQGLRSSYKVDIVHLVVRDINDASVGKCIAGLPEGAEFQTTERTGAVHKTRYWFWVAPDVEKSDGYSTEGDGDGDGSTNPGSDVE